MRRAFIARALLKQIVANASAEVSPGEDWAAKLEAWAGEVKTFGSNFIGSQVCPAAQIGFWPDPTGHAAEWAWAFDDQLAAHGVSNAVGVFEVTDADN